MEKQDIKHFELLFKKLQPKLFVFCCKYVEDKELARDLVQECFMNLWENYDFVQSSYESYLFTAVRNSCFSYFRQAKVHADYEELVSLQIKEYEIHPEIPSPLMDVYLKEIDILLKSSIEKLPPKCRSIFMMSRYEGKKNQEIARILGISVRTVEAQIYNALKVLKAQLRDYLPGL
ncbi:MAG: RNA polymerase sigma-70 factor [Tannerellaceae bacterium]|jgi:RNA polymerase sigma-70 factor (ECF subfamily)|nr:RNA polymerase sigma-70 factor [Tannerellaceae bacterium]